MRPVHYSHTSSPLALNSITEQLKQAPWSIKGKGNSHIPTQYTYNALKVPQSCRHDIRASTHGNLKEKQNAIVTMSSLVVQLHAVSTTYSNENKCGTEEHNITGHHMSFSNFQESFLSKTCINKEPLRTHESPFPPL